MRQKTVESVKLTGTSWAWQMSQKENSALEGAEMVDNVELKLSDRLAVERTVLAADRSMLSVVRTSINFIGFGFAIYKTLQYLQEQAPVPIMRPQTPRNFGLFMLLAGTVPLFVMMIQYYRTLKRIGAGTKVKVFSNPVFQMSFAALLLGTVLLVTLTVRILLQ